MSGFFNAQGKCMAYESRLSLTIDSRTGERSLKRLDSSLDRTEQKGRAASSTMISLSRAVGLVAAAAGGLTFGRVIRETAGFEDAMLGLNAVSGATADQMEALEKQARTLGATSLFSAQQAGEAQRFLAQAGFEVNEILSATPGILKLATAGQLDLARAADIASNVLGGMGLQVSELNRVNDVLAGTAAGSNTSIEQLGEALSFAAPFAASAGISIEEAAASIGVMSDAGIQASRAGTGLVGVIRQLSRVTPAAADALERAGLSAEDVNIEANGLEVVLDRLRRVGLDTGQAIEIFGSEAGAAAQVLFNGSKRVSEFTDQLADADGEADRMSQTIGSGLTGSMRAFNSMLSEAIISLGKDDGVAGGFQDITDTATGVLAVYNGLLPEFAEVNDLTSEQSENLEAMANGLGLVSDAAVLAAGVVGTRYAVALGAAATALASKTATSISDARAEAVAAQQVARRTAAELQAAQTIQARAIADAKATAGTNAHAFAMQNLTAASARATAAQGAHTVAVNASTAAMGRASIAARGAAGAMALLGGPVGAAIIAAGSIYYFREELGLTSNEAITAADAVGEVTQAMQGLNLEAQRGFVEDLQRQFSEAESVAESLEEKLARIDRPGNQGGVSGNIISQIRDDLGDAEIKASNLEKQLAAGVEQLKGFEDARKSREAASAIPTVQDVARRASGLRPSQSDSSNQVRGDSILEGVDAQARGQDIIATQMAEAEAVKRGLDRQYAIEQQHAERIQALRDGRRNGVIETQAELDALIIASTQQRNEELAQIEQQRFQLMTDSQQQALGSLGDAFGNFAQIAKEGGKDSFNEYKAFASAQAAISASLAAIRALAEGGPFLGPILAASIGGLAAVQIANIQSQEYAGQAHDGIDKVPNSGTWNLKKGERVMTAQTSAKLDRKLDNMQDGASVAPQLFVNIHEDASKAGMVEQRQRPDGGTDFNVFVSDIYQGGPRSKALEAAYGLQRQGR